MNTTKVGLVLNLLTVSISQQYLVVIYYVFYTVVSITAVYPEFWVMLVTSRNSVIKIMLYLEDDPDLDDKWLTSNYILTRLSTYGYNILGRVKGANTPSVQGPQYSEKDLVLR